MKNTNCFFFQYSKRHLKIISRNISVSKRTANQFPPRETIEHYLNTMTAPTIEDKANSPYSLIDIGANLTHPTFHPVDAVIQRAVDSGVKKLIVTGTSLQNSQDALRLTRLFPGTLYFTSGVHPHDAKEWTDETETAIEKLAKEPECVAIGECGLDFNRNFSPQDVQQLVFEKQVAMACKLKKPLFCHEREASDTLLQILLKYHNELPNVVIHCFTGTVEEAERYLKYGFYIGLTGFLWKDKSDDGVRRILKDRIIPLDKLLIETDAPYMYPNITRKSKVPADIVEKISDHAKHFLKEHCNFSKNEPCSLPTTMELISAFYGTSPQVLASNAYNNSTKVFGIL